MWFGSFCLDSCELQLIKVRIYYVGLPVNTGQEKVSLYSNAKECSNYLTIALISQASKVMLKILQASLQQYVNRELPDVQAGSRKGRGTRDQIVNIHWIIKKAQVFQKNIYFCLLTMPNPLTI